MVRSFYFCHQLEYKEASALIQKHNKIYRAKCVCSEIASLPAQGGCFYFDDAALLYEKYGPLPVEEINKQSVMTLVEKHRNNPRVFLMTVGQNANCWFFPANYVLCICDKQVCLPWQYQNKLPATPIINSKIKTLNSYLAHFKLLLSLPILLPPFLIFTYKRLSQRKKILAEICFLMLIAFTAGIIISCPKMFVYLHNPEWFYNQFWFVLLPIGIWGEIVTIFGVLYLFARKKIQSFGLFRLTIRSLVAFEMVHLVRFFLVFYLTGTVDFKIMHKVFWAFDLPAWAILFILLYFGYKKQPVVRLFLK